MVEVGQADANRAWRAPCDDTTLGSRRHGTPEGATRRHGSVKKLQRDVPRADGLSIGRAGKVSSMRIAWSHRDNHTAAEAAPDSRPTWIDGVGQLPSEPPRIAAPRAADAAATTPAAVQAA